MPELSSKGTSAWVTILVALITGVCGIIGTLITVRYSGKKEESKPVVPAHQAAAPKEAPTPPLSAIQQRHAPITSPTFKVGSSRRDSPTVQSCPDGNCIGADNYGNPTVNNYGPPRRSLTPDQRTSLIKALKTACPFDIAVRPLAGNEEAMAFAERLKSALSEAGCTLVRPKFLIDTAVDYGVIIGVQSNDTFPPGANVLMDALKAGGMEPKPEILPMVEPGVVYLMVEASPAEAERSSHWSRRSRGFVESPSSVV
jgi:hypothetical protein